MKRFDFNLDALGVCASALCMIHCLVFPLLLLLLPFLPTLGIGQANGSAPVVAEAQAVSIDEECSPSSANAPVASEDFKRAACCSTPTDFWIHVGLFAAVAPLGLVAWGAGYRQHGFWGVLLLGGAGVALLSGALLFGHNVLFGRGEQVMTVTGSLCMVSAHVWNRQKCRCCPRPGATKVVEIDSPAGNDASGIV